MTHRRAEIDLKINALFGLSHSWSFFPVSPNERKKFRFVEPLFLNAASRTVGRILRAELDVHVRPDARASQRRKDRCPDRTQRLWEEHLLEAGRPHRVPRPLGQLRSGRFGRPATSERHLYEVSLIRAQLTLAFISCTNFKVGR